MSLQRCTTSPIRSNCVDDISNELMTGCLEQGFADVARNELKKKCQRFVELQSILPRVPCAEEKAGAALGLDSVGFRCFFRILAALVYLFLRIVPIVSNCSIDLCPFLVFSIHASFPSSQRFVFGKSWPVAPWRLRWFAWGCILLLQEHLLECGSKWFQDSGVETRFSSR